MRAPLLVSFAIAAAFHAVLLFGFRWETAARPLPMGIASAAVDLDLTAAPEGEPDTASTAAASESAQPAATPAPPAPEAVPAIPPEPTSPPPAPVALPSPSPEPAVAASTPPPVPPATAVKRQNPKPRSEPSSHTPTEDDSVRGRTPGNAVRAGGRAEGGNAEGGMEGVRVRSNPRPEYPAQARRERQEGVVLVSVEIGPDGNPVEVALGRTSGFPLLDAAALRAVRRWRFEPATFAGRATASHAEVPIRFNLVP